MLAQSKKQTKRPETQAPASPRLEWTNDNGAGLTLSGSPAPRAELGANQNTANVANSEPSGYFGESSTFRLLSNIRPNDDRAPLDNIPPSSSLWLGADGSDVEDAARHYQFPTRHFADQLVDAYFERVHILYPFIHESSFRAEYELMWSLEDPASQSIDSAKVAILNLVFAYGCEFCQTLPEQDIFSRAAPFVARARKIIFSHTYKNTDFALVQAMLLLSHYLQGTLELNECWILVGLMVRSAVSIGLHQDPTDRGSLTSVEREMRKRLWWGCFILDRTLSMKYGRPPSINTDDAMAVDFPLEVDDQYISESAIIPRQPSNRPSRITFFSQTIKLSFIIDKTLSELYLTPRKKRSNNISSPKPSASSNEDEYCMLSRTVYLDGKIQAWWNDMPKHLRVEPEQMDGLDFQRQRCVVRIRYESPQRSGLLS